MEKNKKITLEATLACPAYTSWGTVYAGVIEIQHGLPSGSPECSPGCQGYHYLDRDNPGRVQYLDICDKY